MLQRVALLFCLVVPLLRGEVPTPASHLGFRPGTDYKLANYEEIISYYQRLATVSDRIKLEEFGKTSNGKPMFVAFFSAPENLKQLARFRDISASLARGEGTQEQARDRSKQGKAIVWIDSGLHATEVAPVQHSPELAYRMLTAEDDETRRIRQNVILMQIPCINPDGLDMVVDWYRKNVGSEYELAPLPFLYQKYAGHDNNRDWFMLNLPETRAVSKLLFQTWFPQIVYNQHQAPPFPARIFVPPYAEPLNPNIPAPVMEGINLIGAAMKERFARENKPGVLSYWGFDAWWNGGLRSAPAFHNMHGILTETALHGYGTPRDYKLADLPERFGNGMPAREPGVFYERPWLGGKWGTREAIEYMLTADMAILDLAASRAPEFLFKAWDLAQANINAGKNGAPYAYLIDPAQPNATEMLQRLAGAGVRLNALADATEIAGKPYPRGTVVISTAQPFRGYLMDLMEPQRYPEIRNGATGPVKRPYDIAGWTLWMSMGVKVARAEAPVQTQLADFAFDLPASRPPAQTARIGVYESWMPNSDAGWTEWTLDYAQRKYTVLRDKDLCTPGLRERFDSIILPSDDTDGILHGFRESQRPARTNTRGDSPALQRPEYSGGIGVEGLVNLDRFVREGGRLIALNEATELPVRLMGLPVRSIVRNENYQSPGSLINIVTAKGEKKYAFSIGGQAWDIALDPAYNKGDREVKVLARYADKDVLASGWINGEKTVAGKPIALAVPHGKGSVVLFGFSPQFRGQTFGTFDMFLEAIR